MFFLNLGYHWQVPELDCITGHGVCVAAQGVDAQSALTRDRVGQLPAPGRRLFDPQLYLRDLSYDDCAPVVRRLATHAWINPGVPVCGEGEGVREWTKRVFDGLEGQWPIQLPVSSEAVRTAVDSSLAFQNQFGVGRLIIPGPMIRDPEDDFSEGVKWIDVGLEAAQAYGDLPVYATLAISDSCLVHRDPPESELLKTVVDQVAARTDLQGVYLVLEQTVPPSSAHLADTRAGWALLAICHDLGSRACLEVVVNYAGVFGLTCLAAGAVGFCTGPTAKAARLCLSDFETREGGGALPRFYAHSLVLDLLPKTDLEDRIAERRLLRLMEQDGTEWSESLLKALREGRPVNDVGEWQQRLNNVTASRCHYTRRVARAVEEMVASDDKVSAALGWLQDAERDAGYLASRFDTDPLSADHRHVRAWRVAFESFIAQYGL